MPNNRYTRLALRGSTKANLKIMNPLPREREPIVEIDTGKMKIGDGIHRYNKLKYVDGGNTGAITKPTITLNPSMVEKGSVVDSVTINYSFTGEPDKVVLKREGRTYVDETYPDKTSGTIVTSQLTNPDIFRNNTEFIIQLIVDDAQAVTNSDTLTFASRMYYGIADKTIVNDEIFTNNITYNQLKTLFKNGVLNKSFITSKNKEIESDCSGTTKDNYLYIFMPASIFNQTTQPKFSVGVDGSAPIGTGGISMLKDSFTNDNDYSESDPLTSGYTIDITNENNYTESFYVFRTNYYDLGMLKVTIS